MFGAFKARREGEPLLPLTNKDTNDVKAWGGLGVGDLGRIGWRLPELHGESVIMHDLV